MKTHTLNLFAIANALELDFSYKLIPAGLSPSAGSPADRHRELQNMARKVRSATQGPAAIVTRTGVKYIAIPADRTLPEIIHKSTLFGIVRMNLPADAAAYSLQLAGCSDEEHALIMQFLEFAIRKLIKDTGQVVEDQAGRFFFKKPLASPPGTTIEMLEGFSLKIVAEGRDKLAICLDISYRYVAKDRLSKTVTVQNAETVQQTMLRRKRGQKALMMFGDWWFPVEILGFGKRIDQQEFEDINGNVRTVYEYTRTETQKHSFRVSDLISPDDVSVIYCYPGRRDSMAPRHGAASLMRLLYDTEDKDVQRLHRESILPTPKRFKSIADKVGRFFTNLHLNGQPLTITVTPQQETLRECRLPALLFGNNKVMTINGNHRENAVALPHFGEQRRKWVQENGFLGKLPPVPQYLFVPQPHPDIDISGGLLNAFQQDFEDKVRQLVASFSGFLKVVSYAFNPEVSATEQVDMVREAAEAVGVKEGRALFILPSFGRRSKHGIKRFHACLKKKFSAQGLWFQCASYERIQQFYAAFPDDDTGLSYKLANTNEAYKFDSYLFYLSTSYLLMNRVFPYALHQPLNYDIYIGIDVHDRNGGFVFFYKNGEKIFFDTTPVPHKNRHSRAEKLTEEQIFGKIYEKLKIHLPRVCSKPNGIVLVRDGRSHGGETLALKRAIALLHRDGLLDQETVRWAVVDVHKQSAVPLRAGLTYSTDRPLELPRIGTVKKMGRDLTDAFVFNTGYPFRLNGSVRPLHLSFIEGSCDFDRIISDLFAQTLLAFSAPDRPCGLPIIIKLLDTFLEPLSYTEEDWGGKPDVVADLQTDDVESDILEDAVNS